MHELALCQALLDEVERVARDHPGMFVLMFSPDHDPDGSEELRTAAAAAYGVLAEGCAPFVPEGARPEETEFAVWSMVHGYAHLSRRPHAAPPEHGRLPVAFTDIFRKLALGRA